MTYLGTTIGKDISMEQRWAPLIQKINGSIAKWSLFPLPFKTRAVVVSCYLVPKIRYHMCNELLDQGVQKKLDVALRRYLWNSSRGKIRKCFIYNHTDEGGLGLPNLDHEAELDQLAWLSRLIKAWKEAPTPGAELGRFFLGNLVAETGLQRSVLHTNTHLDPTALCPDFYRSMVHMWRKVGHTDYTDLNRNEGLSQPLANVDSFTALGKSRQTVFAARGVIRLRDIIDDDNSWMSVDRIRDYNKLITTKAELESLQAEIPEAWVESILSSTEPATRLPDGTMSDCTDILPDRLHINSKKLTNLSRKDLPKRAPCLPPQHHIVPAPWKKVWKPRVPTQWNQTFFLFLHKAHYTAEKATRHHDTRLQPNCSCGRPETEVHLFWECPFAQDEWKKAWRRQRATHRPPPFTLDSILNPPRSFEVIHREVLHHIWTMRCGEVYGQTPRPVLIAPPLPADVASRESNRALFLSVS